MCISSILSIFISISFSSFGIDYFNRYVSNYIYDLYHCYQFNSILLKNSTKSKSTMTINTNVQKKSKNDTKDLAKLQSIRK